MATPRISVGLPVYNGGKYLVNTLTRLLGQDFEDFELIICDNASTDETPEICQTFAARDFRIRYHRNSRNIGLAANNNRTFELSRGEFFKWVAHDDDFPAAMLGRFLDALENSAPEVGVVYSECEYIDELGNVVGVGSDGVDLDDARPYRRMAHLLWHIHMYNSNYGLIRSHLVRKTRLHGLFPMSDHVFLAELAMLCKFVELPEPLLRIRQHPGRSFAANKTERSLRELFNPGHGNDFSLLSIRKRMEFELVRSTMLAHVPLKDKVPCIGVAAVTPHWRMFRAFGGRQKQKLLRMWSPETGRFWLG
jgi:glycosyltransferase involved in cell wall biosynthesis